MVPGQGCVLGLSLLARRCSCSHTEAVPVCACLSPCPRRPHPTQLYQHVPDSRWPIVYSPRYNITFLGLEKLHPFDAGKWGKVISLLKGMEAPAPDLHLLPAAHLPPPPCCLALMQASDAPAPASTLTALHPCCQRISPTQPSELNLAPQHTFTGSRSLGTQTLSLPPETQ